jgi:hypothetical protein
MELVTNFWYPSCVLRVPSISFSLMSNISYDKGKLVRMVKVLCCAVSSTTNQVGHSLLKDV